LVGAATAAGTAGCGGSGSPDTATRTATPTGTPNDGLPSQQAAVESWGERINEFAREAAIDWQQFDGESIVMGMNVHPFTETTRPLLPYFEDLTGIEVVYNSFPEEELWTRIERDMQSGGGAFDGLFLGLWPSAGYHEHGWVADLRTFISNPSITDREWLHLEDFPVSTLESYTYQGSFEGSGELVALPFGVEVYGCVGYDSRVFDQLDITEPTTYAELSAAAERIHESDAVEKAGIVSRASDATLSTADWATMFRSYGAEWLDYDGRAATLDSQAAVDSLADFATMLGEYGPAGVAEFEWYNSIQSYANGDVGMVIATPNLAGLLSEDLYEATEWLAPMDGPGGERVAANWQWGLGVSGASSAPKATWLFLQWLTSRPVNFLVSTQQWAGQSTYGHARANYLFDHPDYDSVGQKASWVDAFTEGLGLVPDSPPPVPFHTPQNMSMMNHAATAMNAAIRGDQSAAAALSDAADAIDPLASEIPDEYV
jgi:multiple sugar transport system substrate-binding protein